MLQFARWRFALVALMALGGVTSAFAQHGGSLSVHAAHSLRANDPIYTLYDLMEPMWNAPPGKSRDDEACAIREQIKERVRAVALRPTPEHAAMIRTANALEEACIADKEKDVEQEIDRLSRLFYRARISRIINR
jgi:hypothetical protein